MTKNSAIKRAARAYQQGHPGTRLADALRAVADTGLAGWRRGQEPLIRRGGVATCYFCGKETVIISATDMRADPGRVAVYCDTGDCDAREVEVLIVDDGSAATRGRTDVRILAHFPPKYLPPLWGTGLGQDWAAGTAPYVRTHREPLRCLFCGETTCRPSQYDISNDDARIRLYCSNSRCQVGEVEALVMRDELRALSERPDIQALNALYISRADRLAAELPPGEPPLFEWRAFAEPAEGVDPLAMRISGPVPWVSG